ncbi:hypothetical protein BaRGS_00011416 [Batillaria attramentaria]|uniref:Uncharacterized protein n=1 Tax=Batillaria attramentaria TaxID=370345 RepID=A0ABD0LCR2_9CAEN
MRCNLGDDLGEDCVTIVMTLKQWSGHSYCMSASCVYAQSNHDVFSFPPLSGCCKNSVLLVQVMTRRCCKHDEQRPLLHTGEQVAADVAALTFRRQQFLWAQS